MACRIAIRITVRFSDHQIRNAVSVEIGEGKSPLSPKTVSDIGDGKTSRSRHGIEIDRRRPTAFLAEQHISRCVGTAWIITFYHQIVHAIAVDIPHREAESYEGGLTRIGI